MFKNVAGQKEYVYAHDVSADQAKTGDAANITAYISQDGSGIAQSNDVNPTELDATNMKGVYAFDVTQAETNGNVVVTVAVSGTANIRIDPVVTHTIIPAAGAGSVSFSYVVLSSGDPIFGVEVQAYTNEAATNRVARGFTDATGTVVFQLPTGNIYFVSFHPDFSFDNPDLEVVS
jgi:hypothetical protein